MDKGQKTIARLVTYDDVNKRLQGLHLSTPVISGSLITVDWKRKNHVTLVSCFGMQIIMWLPYLCPGCRLNAKPSYANPAITHLELGVVYIFVCLRRLEWQSGYMNVGFSIFLSIGT
ncbi:uncharacterized protein LOC113336693 [Papaver somniferum]|uniref:uncharacterized protein LOC113336693 n=1 Tax=Papaver somniferum TaxID=3469 RepID=UPI000E701FB0|nr:uncharacterized protein LOC113336693 [Papaver somniferum]